ncbi:fungal pheromone STE3G-protein-coupled receptor [Aureobasidium pullulans]|nr:fungal pheromone STE3G-protein-coupled receptor [Aureobasidium pullulans]
MATPENYMIVETHIIPQGIILAVLAPFVFILNFPPLIWHFRNRNTAAICMVFWVMLMNFMTAINVIIWPYIDMRSMYDGQGLCDVEIKLLGARSPGLTAAVLCLLRALARVLNTEKNLLGPTKAQKRRNTGVEMGWCVVLPLFTMLLQWIVQFNRFALTGVSGCQPFITNDWTGWTLTALPLLLTNAVAVYYAVIVIIRLFKYKSSFNSILASSNTTRSRFLRLFIIAFVFLIGITPLQIYILVVQVPPPGTKPFSFSTIHDPSSWNSSVVIPSTVLYDRWTNLGCGLLIFFFFGLGKDAVGMYREWLVKLGLGGCFPVLLQTEHSQRGVLSSDHSKIPLRRKSSWSKIESSRTSCSRASVSPRSQGSSQGRDVNSSSPIRPRHEV